MGGVLHRPRWFPTVRRGDVRLAWYRVSPGAGAGLQRHQSPSPLGEGSSYTGGENRVRSGPGQAVAAYMQGRGREKGAVFTFASGTPSSRDKLVWCLRAALCKAGIEAGKYAGCSLRIGAATICSNNKYGGLAGQGWESAAYLLYGRVPRGRLAAVTGRLAAAERGGGGGGGGGR